MNSLEIREAKIKLISMVNDMSLPLEVKRMMLQEVVNELNVATEREINAFLAERKAAEKNAQETEHKEEFHE